MKWQETGLGTKADFADFIKKMIPDLFASRFAVEGKQIALPADKDLDYKVKYDEDEAGGSFTIKVSWDNETGNEEDEEVEVDVD
jgi:hypothetical protein